MRPTTPQFRANAGPSSPPATPTAISAPNFVNPRNKRHGIIHTFAPHITPITTEQPSGITPIGEHSFSFSYNPFTSLDLELSPRSRSSSPASTTNSSARADSLDPRSRSSSPESPRTTKNPPRTRIVKEGNFILEEFAEQDYATFNPTSISVIQPSQYEDAESDRARSTKGVSPSPDDPRMLHRMSELNCSASDEDGLSDREIWLAKKKRYERRRRRSSAVSKRSHAQSIGSDTDDDDVQPILFDGVNEIGSSARRLRRKVGDRGSLIFDDPPARIEELEEPESCEEVMSVGDEQDIGLRDLPYWVQEDMEIDEDEDEDDDEE